MHSSNILKKRQYTSHQRVLNLHRSGTRGIPVGLALTRHIDTLVQRIYEDLSGSEKRQVCVVALGGYGRRELSFYSDIDIMFLVHDDTASSLEHTIVKRFLHRLIDLNLDIGHSVRTIEHCLELKETDFESWVSLLDSRFVVGKRTLFNSFQRAFRDQIRSEDASAVIAPLQEWFRHRHTKYGNSTKLLEPNIKKSAGGLRDLHMALWIMLGTGQLALPRVFRRSTTGIIRLFELTWFQKKFGRRELSDVKRAFDFLLRTRHEMHVQSKSLHDILGFSLQPLVASALGYRSSGKRSKVERFMQDYYVAVRSVDRFCARLIGMVEGKYRIPLLLEEQHDLDNVFTLRMGEVELRVPVRALSNESILHAAIHAVMRSARFSDRLEDAIAGTLPTLRPLRTTRETDLFRALLTTVGNVSLVLHRLNELGVIAQWIPEWRPMVAFFQHNVYHYYTADEHTFQVLREIESLGTQKGAFADLFASVRRKDILYLACLLHDIAKPHHIGDHEVVGARMSRLILERLKYEDAIEDVQFLIRNHLMMEQVAFRRDLSDPQTIIDFASMFVRLEQLDYLYLLTCGDLKSVNTNVWTDWKGMLLHELYSKARKAIMYQMSKEEYQEEDRATQQRAINKMLKELSVVLPEEASRSHLEALDSPRYIETFDAAEIAEHIRRIESSESVSAIFRHQGGVSEVTIIARDQPYALSRFCGVLSANDINILGAQIFTRNDGIIIDKFKVVDMIGKSSLRDDQCERLHAELNDVFEDRATIAHLMDRHRMKWKRRSRPLNPNVRIGVEFEDHQTYTIIDVYAADMLGFLYKITETLSRLGLNIYFAKIATRVDGIVDTFYVLDRDGKRITNPMKRELIEAELLRTINQLLQTELVLT